MADSKTNNQHNKNSFKFPHMNKMTILRIYIAIIWFTTALILLIAIEMASYEDVKYFFWTASVLVPLFYVLYTKGVPHQLSKEQEKEQKKAIFLLAFSFICLIIALFTAILFRY